MQETAYRSARGHAFYYAAGIAYLALAKAKHGLRGYSTPKPYGIEEADRCIGYAVDHANEYMSKLAVYGYDIAGKRVLELGPGSDLALGLYLVKSGAASYVGFDRYGLAESASEDYYRRMADRTGVDVECLRDGRVVCVVRPDFDLTALEPDIDLAISNAAFEHFDDVGETVTRLSRVVKQGSVACITVDLQTHSRWIREADPNNIYRYPEWLYRLFYFPGQPNRFRPHEYQAVFESNGWTDVVMIPENRLSPLRAARPHGRFAGDRFWSWLSFTLWARRDERASAAP